MEESFIRKVWQKIDQGVKESEIRKWIGQELNVGKTRRNDIFNQISSQVNPAPTTVQVQEVSDKLEVSSGELLTVEQLRKVHNLDEDKWEINKFGVTHWDGKVAIKGEFRNKVEERGIEDLLQYFTDQAANHSPKIWKTPSVKNGKYLYFLHLPDVHLSKLTWDKEVGQDYDLKIAKKLYSEAIDDLLSKAGHFDIEKVVILAGSDFFQADTPNSTTTKGTYVDTDSRWTKVFQEGCDLMVQTIEKINSKYSVQVIQSAGNHDRSTSYYLGLYLQAWFRNNDSVLIDCGPAVRKYVAFGKNLIGVTHGDGCKLADLPLLMMRENQETISNYKWMEWLTGHIHMEKTIEIKGVKVRISPALCPSDQWHSEKGYVGNIQNAQGFMYEKDNGLEAIFYSRPVT